MKFSGTTGLLTPCESHPARGARIEMMNKHVQQHKKLVAPREGCAD